ncbi:MAG: YHS domain-containing protein [Acidobacteria bacterium]|nr:YHS domain-containing protein [Acidobacteriota bacterium]
MAMQTDPVCGMRVDDQKVGSKSQYQGTTYFFCSDECKRKFEQQPELYTIKSGQAQGGGQAKRGGTGRS